MAEGVGRGRDLLLPSLDGGPVASPDVPRPPPPAARQASKAPVATLLWVRVYVIRSCPLHTASAEGYDGPAAFLLRACSQQLIREAPNDNGLNRIFLLGNQES